MMTPEQEQRQELLKKIRPYIYEHGVFNVDFYDVAAGVGIDPATLREFFESKEDIVSALLAEVRIEGRSLIAALEVDGTLSLAQVRKRQWEGLVAHKAELRFFFEAYALALRDTDQTFVHGINDWLDLVTANLLRRGVPRARAAILASLVIAVYRGLEMDFVSTGDLERLNAAIDMWAEAEAYLAKTHA